MVKQENLTIQVGAQNNLVIGDEEAYCEAHSVPIACDEAL